MLSIEVIKDVEAARVYYSEGDNYYTSGREPSQWAGKGARHFGLNGEVEAALFFSLLGGDLPDGRQIPATTDVRRAGFDLTFSAPKSISLQALIGGDERLVAAHQQAVARALAHVEGLAEYRVTEDGRVRIEESGNLLIASFLHDLSRDLDPQLHTHAVVINATRRDDGEWRALEVGKVLRQKMLTGALYRAELALAVRALGYDVRLTHSDGFFELKHINDAQVVAFSSRSQAIKAALAARGKTRDEATHHEKSIATLATRNAKGEVDRVILHRTWQEKAIELGVEFISPIAQGLQINVDLAEVACEAVEFAVAHATEREAVVLAEKIWLAALAHGMGCVTLADIQAEIARQVSCGDLIEADGRYTTRLEQQREREVLLTEQRGRGAVAPMVSDVQALEAPVDSALTFGQKAAVALIATTSNRFVAVQGLAGTGKTTMLHVAGDLAEAHGYRFVGVAPSAAATRELSAIGIDSETIAAFIVRGKSGLTPQSVLVVDEAGMVSTRDMLEVFGRVEAADARAVLVGDVSQLKSVDAGEPFSRLQDAGIAVVEMSEILRQGKGTRQHRAVELAAAGDIPQSVAALGRQIIEIGDYVLRHQQIARDFALLSPEDRSRTLIVSGTRAARASINEQVRHVLGLAGTGMKVTTLERKDLTSVQARSSLSYQPGDVVQARRKFLSLGLCRGDWARVANVISPGKVRLLLLDGSEVEWRPAVQNSMAVYQECERELAVGDAIRFTENDHAREIVNGEHADVVGLDDVTRVVTVRRREGLKLTLDALDPMHLDYGYCTTVHASQGQTVDRVLIDADAHSLTANQSIWYVAISRARKGVTIYTDDWALLPAAMSRVSAKSSALDLDAGDVPQGE